MLESEKKIKNITYKNNEECCCEKYAEKREQLILEIKETINIILEKLNGIIFHSKLLMTDNDWIKKMYILIPDIMENIEEDIIMFSKDKK